MGGIPIPESFYATASPARDPGEVRAQQERAQLAMGNQARQGSSLLQDAVIASLGRTKPVTSEELKARKKREANRKPFL